jgi:hypothetical protein
MGRMSRYPSAGTHGLIGAHVRLDRAIVRLIMGLISYWCEYMGQ